MGLGVSLHPGARLMAPCSPQGLCGVLLGAVVLSEGSADGGGDGGPRGARGRSALRLQVL